MAGLAHGSERYLDYADAFLPLRKALNTVLLGAMRQRQFSEAVAVRAEMPLREAKEWNRQVAVWRLVVRSLDSEIRRQTKRLDAQDPLQPPLLERKLGRIERLCALLLIFSFVPVIKAARDY
jgi:hypothetical protein